MSVKRPINVARLRQQDRARLLEFSVDRVVDPVLWVRSDGQLLYVNEAACACLAYSRSELLSMTVFHIEPNCREAEWTQRWNAVKQRGCITVRSEYRRNDGSVFPMEVTISHIELDGNAYQCFFCRDTSEHRRLEYELKGSYEKLQRTTEATIQTIATILETRDPYTAAHQQQVKHLACAIAGEMSLSEEQISAIRMAAAIHDIGKIYIPAEILSKPGKLGELEYTMIREHPRVGYDILKSIESPWPIAKIVLQHHERMDGSGYPDAISGDQILLEAMIIGVADVVDSMIDHRPYRPARGTEKALEEISRNRAVLYHPDVVDACLRLFRDEQLDFEQR